MLDVAARPIPVKTFSFAFTAKLGLPSTINAAAPE
jgi:hypothetical protein